MNVGPGLPSRPVAHSPPLIPAYSLIVAGTPAVGKSALLRLLLDTAPVSHHASPQQLDARARFLRSSSDNSAFPECDLEVIWAGERVLLRLIDTPALDFATGSDDDLERALRDILGLVESRYIDGARDETTVGESHVHLCLYVLDPATIVPRPTIPYPFRRPSPADSPQPPPQPAALPPVEIAAIRRLSSRVNVLPVLGRCDAVPLARLAEVKRAVRRDLADAGLGFGIFDNDATAPCLSPEDLPLPLLPYALFSPESFPSPPPAPDHDNDVVDDDSRIAALQGRFIRRFRWGVLDALDGRHSDFLALRRATMLHHKVLKKYTKEYLYEKFKVDSLLAAQQHRHGRVHPGSVHALLNHRDERDQEHDYPRPASTAPRSGLSPVQHHHPAARLPAVSVSPYDRDDDDRDRIHLRMRDRDRERDRERDRDRDDLADGGPGIAPVIATVEEATPGRKRKITMACSFCRSRKLKCDGVRPACAQCVKRNNTCDYQPHNAGHSHAWKYKRAHAHSPHPAHWGAPGTGATNAAATAAAAALNGNGNGHVEDVDELDEEASSASEYVAPPAHAHAHPSHANNNGTTNNVATPAQRKRVSVDMLIAETLDHPNQQQQQQQQQHPHQQQHNQHHPHPHQHPHQQHPAPPSTTTTSTAPATATAAAAAVAAPTSSAPWYEHGTGMGILDVGSEGDKKKRLNRQSANYGSKAVACVHCRARKTRCDAARPACGNCARRALACSYVHTQPSQPRSKGKRLPPGPAAGAPSRSTATPTPTPVPVPVSISVASASTPVPVQASASTWSPGPVPVDSALEESAERDRPLVRSPAAPPIATLSGESGGGVGGGGGGGREGGVVGVKRSRSGSGSGSVGSVGSVGLEEGEEERKRMRWDSVEGQGPQAVRV